MRKTYKITYLKRGGQGHSTAIVEAYSRFEAELRLCKDITGNLRANTPSEANIAILNVEELKF